MICLRTCRIFKHISEIELIFGNIERVQWAHCAFGLANLLSKFWAEWFLRNLEKFQWAYFAFQLAIFKIGAEIDPLKHKIFNEHTAHSDLLSFWIEILSWSYSFESWKNFSECIVPSHLQILSTKSELKLFLSGQNKFSELTAPSDYKFVYQNSEINGSCENKKNFSELNLPSG